MDSDHFRVNRYGLAMKIYQTSLLLYYYSVKVCPNSAVWDKLAHESPKSTESGQQIVQRTVDKCSSPSIIKPKPGIVVDLEKMNRWYSSKAAESKINVGTLYHPAGR